MLKRKDSRRSYCQTGTLNVGKLIRVDEKNKIEALRLTEISEAKVIQSSNACVLKTTTKKFGSLFSLFDVWVKTHFENRIVAIRQP